MADKNYITPQGFQRLRDEYAQLLNVERPKLVETVTWAASNGDRSENADYIYGKRRLREIDRRIRFLMGRLEKAEVVDPKHLKNEKVVFSSFVTISYMDGSERTYQIVGEDEWSIEQSQISWRSPMARALLGKAEGDEAEVQTPKGKEIVVVEKIEIKTT